MSKPLRKKYVDHVSKSFEKHIGHVIEKRNGEKFKLAEIKLIKNEIMLRGEGEPFPCHNHMDAKDCECGEA